MCYSDTVKEAQAANGINSHEPASGSELLALENKLLKLEKEKLERTLKDTVRNFSAAYGQMTRIKRQLEAMGMKI